VKRGEDRVEEGREDKEKDWEEKGKKGKKKGNSKGDYHYIYTWLGLFELDLIIQNNFTSLITI
jgi:hypothetical protein